MDKRQAQGECKKLAERAAEISGKAPSSLPPIIDQHLREEKSDSGKSAPKANIRRKVAAKDMKNVAADVKKQKESQSHSSNGESGSPTSFNVVCVKKCFPPPIL